MNDHVAAYDAQSEQLAAEYEAQAATLEKKQEQCSCASAGR